MSDGRGNSIWSCRSVASGPSLPTKKKLLSDCCYNIYMSRSPAYNSFCPSPSALRLIVEFAIYIKSTTYRGTECGCEAVRIGRSIVICPSLNPVPVSADQAWTGCCGSIHKSYIHMHVEFHIKDRAVRGVSIDLGCAFLF